MVNSSDNAQLTRIGDKQLFVETSGEGPEVVLVHGLGGATTFYDPVVAELSDKFTFIRYDFNGHGRSPLSGEVSIDTLAEELADVIHATTSGKAHVVAHSMGTLVAQRLAEKHPETIDKLVLLGPVRAQPAEAKSATRNRADTVRDQGMSAVSGTIARAATSDQAADHNPLLRPMVRELLLGQDAEAYAQACEALAGAENPDLSAIVAKTLLLTGSDDGVSPPKTSESMLDELSTATFHEIPGIGHWTVLESPEIVNDYLSAFLAK